MAIFLVNPRYALPLWQRGLRTATDFLRFDQGQVVNRHRHRQVVLVNLNGVVGYLKRQFHIPMKERLASWWGGFGAVSQSVREWQVLQELHEEAPLAAEPMAVGETGGQAFVLLRALPEGVDLPTLIAQQPDKATRQQIIDRLAVAVARLHGLGFSHPDLFGKHIFLSPSTMETRFIDFQRTRRYAGGVPWDQRCRDLAAFSASLPPEVVPASERLRFLQHYLCETETAVRPVRQQLERRICGRAEVLVQRRKFQRLRAAALLDHQPQLRISGERVRVPVAARATALAAPAVRDWEE